MFFINDDEAQFRHRRKDCQAGADHNVCFAREGCRKMPGTGGLCDLTVQADNGHMRKTLCNSRLEQRSKINFRDQQQNLLALGQHGLDKP